MCNEDHLIHKTLIVCASHIKIPTGACEKVDSDLGLGFVVFVGYSEFLHH